MTDEQRDDLLKQIEKRIRIGGKLISFIPLLFGVLAIWIGDTQLVVTFVVMSLISTFWLTLILTSLKVIASRR